jgi:hypothetical protein
MGAAIGVQALVADVWAWAETLNPIPPVKIPAANAGPVMAMVMRRAKVRLILDLLGFVKPEVRPVSTMVSTYSMSQRNRGPTAFAMTR